MSCRMSREDHAGVGLASTPRMAEALLADASGYDVCCRAAVSTRSAACSPLWMQAGTPTPS